jgi:Tol biopolymer transport system component
MTPIHPPMTDERLDRLVRQLLTERADDVAAAAMPAETMTAVVASHVRRGGFAERRPLLLVAAALLILLAAGAVAVGSGLIRREPEPQPAPQPVVVPSIDATKPIPSNVALKAEHVFYTVFEQTHVGDEGCTEPNATRLRCTSSRIWVADPDGGNARELFPETTDHRSIVDVSNSGDAMVFTAPAQIDGQQIGASHIAELGPAGDVLATSVISFEVFNDGCVDVCANDYAFAFSPDGTRLAFVRASHQGEDPETTVVAVRDVSTGEVIELESTRASGPDGYNGAPVWSPDGRQLLFTRESIGVATPDHRLLDTATFVVDADGSNLRQLVDTNLFARDAAWSPDGSTIAFTSAIAWLGLDQFSGKRENFNEDSDVYTVRADGSDLRRLTNFAPTRVDRGAPVQVGGHVEGWTRDGQIVFTVLRWAGEGDSTNLPPETWIMDADGANARQIDGSDVASLSAAGCVECTYPHDASGLEYKAFWRPAP